MAAQDGHWKMVAISVFRDLVRMAAEVLAFQAPAQRVETLNEQSHASLTVTAIFGETSEL